jgi:hypothetical protein
MSTLTAPRRALARPQLSLNGINTASSPNLGASYSSALQISGPDVNGRPKAIAPKSSLNALTPLSLATIPDASEGYGLSTVLDEDSHTTARMQSITPSHGGDGDDLELGDLVDVPGGMHGTVKFIGNVDGKKGTFAGVELSEEFAPKGKNNGDVDGSDLQTTLSYSHSTDSLTGYPTLQLRLSEPVSFSRSTEQ